MPQMFSSSFFRGDVQSNSQPPLSFNNNSSSSFRSSTISASTNDSFVSPVSISHRFSANDSHVDERGDSADIAIRQQLEKIQLQSAEDRQKAEKARKAGKYLKLLIHCQVRS